jgi:hypothetical protein
MQRFVSLLFLLGLSWPLSAQADLLPHRADYSLRLGPAANALRVGTAVHDLAAECTGWKLRRDINVELALTAAWKMTVASKLDGAEARNTAFRYRLVQDQNGAERQTEGRAQRAPNEVRVEIASSGSPAQFTLPAATLMPVQGIAHMIDRLKTGTFSFPALMFDPEVIHDGFLVDVSVLEKETLRPLRPSDRQVAVPEGRSWPVSLAFTRARQQQTNPLFTVTALVWETGILDRLTVNTGLVSVTADLQALELRKPPSCPRS